MRRTGHPPRRSHAVAVALVLALTSVGPIAPLAFAADTPATPAASTDRTPGAIPKDLADRIAAGDAKFAGQKPPLASDQAIAEAKRTGKPVPVPELTDEYSETVATPTGHLSRTQHAEPQRVKHDNTWATLDATLVPDDHGGYRPRTAVADV
ncbi:hypothetical protein ACFXPX_20635, partial [Kitasatospora sp. NPDC059146]